MMKNVPALFLASALLAACGFLGAEPAVNPDPNHTHADFLMVIEGRMIDFSDEKYMSEAVTDETEPHEHEEGYLHQYLHLHDGVGHVIHRHKPGLTIGEFFDSIGVTMTENCVTLDNGASYCNDAENRWRMLVNGEERALDPAYTFEDLDRLLFVYGADDATLTRLTEEVSDDACLFSRTCPERGDPPAENCVADPSVPCVVPPEEL